MKSLKSTIDVYTGTYEWLEYPDKDGVERPIFLYIEDGERWIPAPKYYWKVNNELNPLRDYSYN